MSGRAIRLLLVKSKSYLSSFHIVDDIVFDSDMSMFEGSHISQYGIQQIVIGVSELSDETNRHTMGRAMVPVVGLFHEVCGHGS